MAEDADVPVSVSTTLDASTDSKPATEPAPVSQAPTSNSLYTTKRQPDKSPEANVALPSSPPSAPAALAPAAPNTLASTPSPFGKSTAATDRQFITGPKSTRAVPIENVDAIETGEPAPAEPEADAANPVKEDPATPTQLTAPMFDAQSSGGTRTTILRVLNKVTARSEKISVKPGEQVRVAKLVVSASHCQHSDPTSLPDDAALVTVGEIVDAKTPAKQIFAGWVYQSSPSINALENPIYDVALVACEDPPVAAKSEAPVKKPKK